MTVRVGLVGRGPHVEVRAAAARASAGATLAERLPEATAAGVIQRQEAALDVVFASGTAGRRVEVAEAALRQGRHVFLEWPPAASVQELERLAERAEEAGAEIGVSRPLRYHPLFGALPAGAPPELVMVETRLRRGPAAHRPRWAARLADALDLCNALARRRPGAALRHLDVQAVRSAETTRLEAVAAALRFHGSFYAKLSLRRALRRDAAGRQRLYAAGSGFSLEATLDGPGVRVRREGEEAGRTEAPGHAPARAAARNAAAAEKTEEEEAETFRRRLLHQETQAFLEALVAGRAAPVSILDALPTMRLTERLLRKTR